MSGPRDLADLAAAVGLEPARHRRADVESLVGIPHTDMLRWWRAIGLAEVPEEEVAFGDDDIRMAVALGALLGGGAVDDRDVLRLARVLGSSFSRIAEAQVALLTDAARAGRADDGSPPPDVLDIATALRDAELLDLLEQSIVYVWRRHLLAALGRRLRVEEDAAAEIRSGAAPPSTADEVEGDGDGEVDAPDPLDSAHGPSATTVGFVDIAGFAKMTRRIDVDDLAEVVDAFEAAALEVIAEHHGRVVKFIGDAVMYVARDLPSGVRIGLELQGRAAAAELPVELHCGVAHGPTITMGGDVFGPAVNLASRLTGVARRGTVVIPRECARELADSPDLQVRSVRRLHDLKGIGRTRLSTVRWADRPETEQPSSSVDTDSDGNGGDAIEGVAAADDAGGPTDGG